MTTTTAPEPVAPDKLDAGVLRVAGVVVLGAIMAILDVTVGAVPAAEVPAPVLAPSGRAVTAARGTGEGRGSRSLADLRPSPHRVDRSSIEERAAPRRCRRAPPGAGGRGRGAMGTVSKRRLRLHLAAFAVVNLVLVVVWYLTTPDALFWPGVPLMGWSVGVLFHIWAIYPPTRPARRHARRTVTHHRAGLS